MGRKKITIVGVGNVGATAAHWAVVKELGDIVLVDVVEGIPQGKALDLMQSTPVDGLDCRIQGTNSYEETKDSDLVIITAGLPRKPGMSRDDLLSKNAQIMKSVVEQVVKFSPHSILIIVSNPLDAMCAIAKKVSGFPRERVVGMAGILDSARFRAFVAMELNVPVKEVTAFVLGGHGDDMVPIPRLCSVNGTPLPKHLSQEKIERIVERTRKGGAEIVSLLKTGSAYYAPGASVIQMAEAILKDKKEELPCAAYLEGEYGVNGYFLGVPVKLGAKGVEQIIEIDLTPEEKQALQKSFQSVKELTDKI